MLVDWLYRDRGAGGGTYARNAGIALFPAIVAFFSLTPKPDLAATDAAFSLNKIIEMSLLLIAAAIVWLLQQRGGRARTRSVAPVIVLAYVAWAAVSSLWAPSFFLAFGKASELFLMAFVAIGVVRYLRHNAPDPREAMADALCWSLIASLVFLFAATAVVHGSPAHYTPPGWDRAPRMIVGYAHPLYLADLAAITGLVACAGRLRPVAALGISAAAFCIIHFTDGRGAMVFFVGCMTLVWWRRIGDPSVRIVLATSALVGLIVYSTWFVQGGLIPADWRDLQGRVPLWQDTFIVIGEHSFLGVGYYNARFYLTEFYHWAGHSHNSYIEVWLTTGLVGLALLGVFLVHAFALALRSGKILLFAVLTYVALEGLLNPLIYFTVMPTLAIFLLYFFEAEEAAAARRAPVPASAGPLSRAAAPLRSGPAGPPLPASRGMRAPKVES